MGDGRLTADRPGHEMADIDNDVDEVSARLEQLEMALADLQSGMEEPWSVSMPDEDEQGHDTLTGLAPDYIDSDDTLRSIGPNSNQRLEIYGFEFGGPFDKGEGEPIYQDSDDTDSYLEDTVRMLVFSCKVSPLDDEENQDAQEMFEGMNLDVGEYAKIGRAHV